MGNIQDIVNIMKSGPKFVSNLSELKLNTKSVARGALDSTFQFPCLISDSIDFPTATVITKTLDHVYATFTQTWLSMNSMFDMTIDPTPMSYLKRLHQNLRLESLTVDEEDVPSYMERVYDGSYRLFLNEEKTFGVLVNVADRPTAKVLESNMSLMKEYLSDYDFSPLEIVATEDSDDFMNAALTGMVDKGRRDANYQKMRSTEKMQAPKLVDANVKKINDLAPYAIQVRLIALNDKKEFVQYIDFIVGVKAILHVVKSEDMIENISRALQNKSLMFKFLRWTTGEISLIKDIILNLDNLKLDAIARSEGRSPFFATLKRLKSRKLGIHNLTVPHALIPNATMVISSSDADYMEKMFAINLRNEKIARKLMDTLFLMTFIIIDEGTNTVSILYDGSSYFQTYSLDTLERDVSMNSNQLQKELGKMLAYSN